MTTSNTQKAADIVNAMPQETEQDRQLKQALINKLSGNEENGWLKTEYIAAAAAVGAGAVVMIGRGEVTVGSAIGMAAGAGASYLTTKYFVEGFGIGDHAIGKLFALGVGIGYGAGFTDIGAGVSAKKESSATEGWFE